MEESPPLTERQLEYLQAETRALDAVQYLLEEIRDADPLYLERTKLVLRFRLPAYSEALWLRVSRLPEHGETDDPLVPDDVLHVVCGLFLPATFLSARYCAAYPPSLQKERQTDYFRWRYARAGSGFSSICRKRALARRESEVEFRLYATRTTDEAVALIRREPYCVMYLLEERYRPTFGLGNWLANLPHQLPLLLALAEMTEDPGVIPTIGYKFVRAMLEYRYPPRDGTPYVNGYTQAIELYRRLMALRQPISIPWRVQGWSGSTRCNVWYFMEYYHGTTSLMTLAGCQEDRKSPARRLALADGDHAVMGRVAEMLLRVTPDLSEEEAARQQLERELTPW